MKKYILLLFITLFGCLGSDIHAESMYSHTHIELLTRKNGLRNNSISAIHQDKEGFIWLGTDVGVSRYDGLSFHNFNMLEKEPFRIHSLYETGDNLLWGWAENIRQIACLDTYTHHQLKVTGAEKETLTGIERFCTVADHLFAIKDSTLTELHATTLSNDEVTLSASAISSVKQAINLFGGKEHLLIPTHENKLFIYHPQTKKLESIDCTGLPFEHVRHIEDIKLFNGYLFFYGSHTGAVIYHLENKHWKQLTDEPFIDLLPTDDRTFVVATWNKLKILQFENKNYLESSYQTLWEIKEASVYQPIMQNRINKLHYDQTNNVLWVCTSGGLVKINFKSHLIENIAHNKHIKRINGLTEDAHGYIWISTQQNGVYKSTGNKVDENLTFEHWGKSNPESGYTLHKDRLGNIWLGDDKGNILVHNPNTQTTTSTVLPEGTIPPIGRINQLFMSSRNRLWIAAEEGLIIYDREKDKVLQHIAYNQDHGKVTTICEDGSGVMWIGTEKGLLKATSDDNQTFSFSGGFEESAGLTPNQVLALYLNSYNQLYATYHDKILQIDGKSKQVTASKVLLRSLSSGEVACIIDDYSGNTWLGTKSGIITINNSSMESYLYEQPQTFYKVIQLNNNHLLWAHSNGLSYFNPDEMKNEMNSQKFYISNIEINYNMLNNDTEHHKLGALLNNKAKLTLEYNENNIKVFITDLRYKDITSKLEYRLLPNDTTWIASYDNYVQLNNMPPGEYRLEVRPPFLTGNKGNITPLDIVIQKHWANTTLAYIGYAVAFLLIAALVEFYLRHRKSVVRANIAKENQFKEEINDIHENEKIILQRNELRYSLAKEMYTPLSLIVAPLKEILNKPEVPNPLNEKIKTAHQNAIGLQNICNLLQYIHEKTGYNRQKLQIASYQASDLADEAMRSSYDMLRTGVIKVFYNREKRVNTEIWVDRERIHFVLINALSNAFRHINYSGMIWFSVQNSKIGGQPYCLFTIKDNGKEHAKKSEVNYISDENYTEGANIFLGWDIIKKDILSHGGNMKITCKEGEGTEVVINLPLGKEHFENNPNIEFITPQSAEENEEIPILAADESEEQAVTKTIVEQPTIEKPESKLKLLIIEDNADIRLYLKVMFAKTYQVLLASNGEEGIRTAEKEIPNLIITDIAMPVMDGFECCKLLKENLKTCHIPIIILTAMAGDENIVKGTELGADDYILKPFNPDILRSKVKNLIKSRTELKRAYTKFLTNEPNSDNANKTEDNTEEKDPFIQKILDIVSNNLQNPEFSVKKLADMLNLSQPTLYRKVKLLTGYTIIELIRGVRIKRAAELLKTKKYSIQEVSEMVGYNDISTFRKHFIDLYGTTPSTYTKE